MNSKPSPYPHIFRYLLLRLRFRRRIYRALLAFQGVLLGVALWFVSHSGTAVDFALNAMSLGLAIYGFWGLMVVYRRNVEMARGMILERQEYAGYLKTIFDREKLERLHVTNTYENGKTDSSTDH